MRHLSRTTTAVAAVACAFAVGATPALAHEFVSTPTGRTKVVNVGTQTFNLGPFLIRCEKAKAFKANRTSESPSNTFFAQLKFSHCATEAHVGSEVVGLKTTFKTPVVLEYHANGFAEFGSEMLETEGQVHISGGTVEVKVAALKCVIEIEEQTIPGVAVVKPNNEYSAALFNTEPVPVKPSAKFPTGFQQRLRIINSFNKMKFEYAEGQCEEFKRPEEEFKDGTYKGTLQAQVVGGDLEYF
jgi:hypothetical protein